jgi:DHA1 family bicyclomycin/chloramphenicol resistance-like MFS transporter
MTDKHKLPFAEFIILMALYTSLMAMSIDMILPALSLMGKDLGVTNENHTQYVIGILFLGFTFGQIIYGPMADSFGRRPIIYLGLAILVLGNILSLNAHDFNTMMLGRLLQGLGAASPRIISTAIIRDLYKGREMARIMSFIMTIFIIIPLIAPTIGQTLLLFANWHIMFVVFLSAAIAAMIWTFFRLPETLNPQNIRPFNLPTIGLDFRQVISNKITLGYAICAGLVFGALIGYVSSARQIFQDYFEVGKLFPLYFGIAALSIGTSSIVNSLIVKKYGMELICHYALTIMMASASLFLLLSILQSHQIVIWQFMIFALVTFFCVGLLFSNLNALAMEPMGHIAGITSAVTGFVSSAISSIIGTIIGQLYNNTLTPMIIGFLLLAVMAFCLQIWIRRK